MLTLGLQVTTQGTKRVIYGVTLESDDHSVVSTFKHFPDKRHKAAQKAREAHHALATALKGKVIAAAVLREADYHHRQRLTDGNKERLRLEGACIAAADGVAAIFEVMDGPQVGRACASTKDEAISAAGELAVEPVLVEAAAAAIAAESLLALT
jgi:hypothetical protein